VGTTYSFAIANPKANYSAFTISSAPPTPVSVTLAQVPLYSGETTWVAVQRY
jgi:hypothetical protein